LPSPFLHPAQTDVFIFPSALKVAAKGGGSGEEDRRQVNGKALNCNVSSFSDQ
jgi:hypothetical protein